MTSVTNGTHYDSDLLIQATAGGKVDLHNATSLLDPAGGDTRRRSIQVTAEGINSTIDFSAMTSFNDLYATGTADGQYSMLTITHGGTVLVSEDTYRLVADCVVARAMAPVEIKGKTGMHTLYEVVALVGGPVVPGKEALAAEIASPPAGPAR